ncbi:unnamed protein product [Allacma fusca]|uniref:Elongation of very long chain fatty acids protein n=1 Tax=Allacma fusca TaxID=39272 RepID=A0A8J2NVE7_9HEXA|nr:unnamed protein product [Allacma fusca]
METADVLKAIEKNSAYITAYDFEVYDVAWAVDQMKAYKNFMYLSIGIYLFLVYFGQKWMENRPAFVLTSTIFLECRTPHNYATSFWGFLFILSKLVEFGDTAFIVLRKQKLITLHWFHHITTLFMCWLGFVGYDALGRLFVMNTFVHSLMYSYYALKALRVKIPRRFAKSLTTIQITQMFLATYVNFASVYFMVKGHPCKRDVTTVYLSGVIIPTFAYLFIKFFRETYTRRVPKIIKSE